MGSSGGLKANGEVGGGGRDGGEGGEGGGDGGDGGDGGGDGGRDGQGGEDGPRAPQSSQSVFNGQMEYSAPGPPSSQSPSEAYDGLPTHVLAHCEATGVAITSSSSSTDMRVRHERGDETPAARCSSRRNMTQTAKDSATPSCTLTRRRA